MARRRRRPLTPAERGSLGGLTTAATTDMAALARARHAKKRDRLRAEIVAEAGEDLADAEVERRVDARIRLEMTRMSHKAHGKLPKTAA